MHGSTPPDEHPAFAPGTIDIPEVIPVFPLSRVVLLPGELLPLHIFEPRYREMVRNALAGHRVIGMVEIATGAGEPAAASPPVRKIGCVGLITEHQELPDGRYLIWLMGLERFVIDEELDSDTLYRTARVTYTPLSKGAQSLAGAFPIRDELRQALPNLVDLDEASRNQLRAQLLEISDSQLIALACQILELPSLRKRQILEAGNQMDRFMLVFEDLYHHLDHNLDLDDLPSHTLN